MAHPTPLGDEELSGGSEVPVVRDWKFQGFASPNAQLVDDPAVENYSCYSCTSIACQPNLSKIVCGKVVSKAVYPVFHEGKDLRLSSP